MKISIFGLGYVGCVTASCLAAEGHQVIGVEVNPTKVEEINSDKPLPLKPLIVGKRGEAPDQYRY